MNEITKNCSDYIFFTDFQLLIIGLFPTIMTIFPNIYSYFEQTLFDNNYLATGVHGYQIELITGIFDAMVLVMIMILTINITFKWNASLNDGSFGYWLTLNVEKKAFLLRSFVMFVGIFSIEIIGTVFFISILGGYEYSLSQYLKGGGLIFLQLSLFTLFAFLCALTITNPELSSIVFLSIAFGAMRFVDPKKGVLAILVPYKLWSLDNIFSDIIMTTMLVITLGMITLNVFLRKDINL